MTRRYGVPVHVVYGCLLHVKGILIDSSILFLGCANLTIHALVVNGGEFLAKFISVQSPSTEDEQLSNNNISAVLYFFQMMVKSALEYTSNKNANHDDSDSDDSDSDDSVSP
jgi:phosphatidylserine/phosphatidylglycerophosphate/cardiolipin synthase-like enzyme